VFGVRSVHAPDGVKTIHNSKFLCCRTRTETRCPRQATLKMEGFPSHPENIHFLKDLDVITHPLGLLVFAHIYCANNVFAY